MDELYKGEYIKDIADQYYAYKVRQILGLVVEKCRLEGEGEDSDCDLPGWEDFNL